jgi:hypothetical protein
MIANMKRSASARTEGQLFCLNTGAETSIILPTPHKSDALWPEKGEFLQQTRKEKPPRGFTILLLWNACQKCKFTLPGTLNLLLSGLRLEIEWTILSRIVLFFTSDILPPLFLGHIQPANPDSPIQQMSLRSSILDLLSQHSLSQSTASRPFLATQ